jgi:hypothetical protein
MNDKVAAVRLGVVVLDKEQDKEVDELSWVLLGYVEEVETADGNVLLD